MKLVDYLAQTPNAATTALLETPGYSYTAFIKGLKGTLGEDMLNIDERWLRDLRDFELHRAYDFYLSYAAAPPQRQAV